MKKRKKKKKPMGKLIGVRMLESDVRLLDKWAKRNGLTRSGQVRLLIGAWGEAITRVDVVGGGWAYVGGASERDK